MCESSHLNDICPSFSFTRCNLILKTILKYMVYYIVPAFESTSLLISQITEIVFFHC